MKAPEPLIWRKSSRSAENGNCVEAGFVSSQVATRDSKHPDGGMLIVDRSTWQDLLHEISSGRWDRAESSPISH